MIITLLALMFESSLLAIENGCISSHALVPGLLERTWSDLIDNSGSILGLRGESYIILVLGLVLARAWHVEL